MNKFSLTIVICAAIVAVSVAVTGMVVGLTNSTVADYRQQLNSLYQNSFYALSDDVNNMENKLSKFSVVTKNTMKEKYLAEVVNLCNSAQDKLSSLPLEHNSIDKTLKFVNQLGGYTHTLREKMANGQDITLDEYDQLSELYDSCVKVKFELNRMANMINAGYSIVDNIGDPLSNSNKFSGEWQSFSNDIVDYPQLIYDGPFSESLEQKAIKGLGSNTVSATEAELLLKKWFEGWDITANGETAGGDFETWNFILEKDGDDAYAQVTKQGGLLLQLGSGIDAGASNKTIRECEILAEEFATLVGIKDAKVVWSTDCEGFVYCNLVYVQDGVIIYPDMIKVKISRADGAVVGWEARSWAFNHTTRTELTPGIKQAVAKSGLDSFLDVLSEKLTVIPGEYSGEKLAWEFKCIKEGNIYYIYIDANTGEDLNVMKVILTDDGEMLM